MEMEMLGMSLARYCNIAQFVLPPNGFAEGILAYRRACGLGHSLARIPTS